MKNFIRKKEFVMLVITLAVSICISLISSVFLRPDNIFDLIKGNVVLGIMAFGMLPVIVSSGIDLSVSSTIVLCSVICGKMLTMTNANLFVIIIVSIIVGALVGSINGLIISFLKIPPIITTLSTMSIILGAVLFFTSGKCITNMPQWFRKFGLLTIGKIPDGNGGTLGIPVQILFFIFAGLITWAILHFTLIGRGAYSIGSNESSAVRVGYNVKHIQIFIYMYSGMMTGLAAVINTSIVQQVDPNTFSGFELSVISAVIIGGASSIGGEGSVFGTVLGVLLLAIINNGMILAKVPTFWQDIVMGLIILFAISINVINKNRAQRKLIRVDIEE